MEKMITKTAYFRFYAELNDFLPKKQRNVLFPLTFKNRQSVKHLVEPLGVPHPEVDLILVHSESRDFSYLVQDEDVISVYPVFESFDISAENKLLTNNVYRYLSFSGTGMIKVDKVYVPKFT